MSFKLQQLIGLKMHHLEMADFDYKNTWKMHVDRHGGQKNTLESLDFMYKILALCQH